MIMTPGKLGEIWKSWLIRDIKETPLSTTMPVIVTERITDLLGVVSISLLGVIAFDRSLLELAILVIPIIGGILFLQYEQGCYRLIDALEHVPRIGQRADTFRNLYENSRGVLSLRPLVLTTAISICSWGLECIGMWLVLRGFGVEISVLVASFVFAVSSILGAISLLPGGVGVTEGSMIGLLLVFNIERAAATSATLVIRAATLWFVAGLAFIVYLSFTRHRSIKVQEFSEEGES